MSLNLILGEKKSGKTKYLMSLISGEKSMLIVPEQRLFWYEKYLLSNLGEKALFLTETLSFKKLGAKVFKDDKNYNLVKLLDKDTKNLLIEKILLENKDKLEVLKNMVRKPEFSKEISSLITEFKKYLITPKDLEDIKEKTDNKNLENKLNDISLIYDIFEKEIKDIYSDTDDLLKSTGDKIKNNKLYKNYSIYIDGFTGFTLEELYVISAFLINNLDVYITLPYNEEKGENKGDLYYTINLTIKRLKRLSEELNCDFKKINLTKTYFESPDIEFLKDNLFTFSDKKYDKKSENVTLSLSNGIKAECKNLCGKIIADLKSGIRAEDMTILVPDITKYEKYLCDELNEFDIPYYLNKKTSVYDTAVALLINNIFMLLRSFNKKDIFLSYLKSGCFFKEEPTYIEYFEDFITSLNIPLYALLKNDIEKIIEDKEKYNFKFNHKEEIIETYNKAVLPLIKLSENIKGKNTALSYSKALYDFFNEIDLENSILSLAKDYEESGDLIGKERMVQVYNYVLYAMERSSLIFGDKVITFEKFTDIIMLELKNKNISSIPLVFDSIMISSFAENTENDKDNLYILGANEEVFPAYNFSEGLINEEERKLISDLGFILSASKEYKALEKRLNAYNNIISPKKLYISYIKYNTSGDELSQSEIVKDIEAELSLNIISKNDFPLSKRKALIYSLKKYQEDDKLKSPYFSYLLNDKEFKDITKESLVSFSKGINKDVKIDYKKLVTNKNLNVSITRLEKYNSCAFSYFAKYLLNAKEKNTYNLNPANIGSYLHFILDSFTKKLSKDNMTFKDLTKEYIDEYLPKISEKAVTEIDKGVFTSDIRKNFFLRKLNTISRRTLFILKYQFEKSEFIPFGSEVSFGYDNSDIEGITFDLSGGYKIKLQGIIDRVDSLNKDDKDYIRIIDYKTNGKTLNLGEVFFGLNIQLATYLMTVLKSKKKTAPGGILYVKLNSPLIQITKSEDIKNIDIAVKKEVVMDGLLLDDDEILKAMDKEIFDKKVSDVINIKLNKKTNALTEGEFDMLLKIVSNKIKETAENIVEGKFNINPVIKEKISTCTYCPYSSVCMYNESEISLIKPDAKTKDDLCEEEEL